MNLALACDVRLAGHSARFDTRFLELGIVPGGGHTWMMRNVVGPQATAATVLFGEVLSGPEAERAGLVSRVVPCKQLTEEAMKAAAKLAEKSASTAMAVKESVNRAFETTLSEGILFERRVFHSTFATEDQKEGMAAFLEKRQPQFRDR